MPVSSSSVVMKTGVPGRVEARDVAGLLGPALGDWSSPEDYISLTGILVRAYRDGALIGAATARTMSSLETARFEDRIRAAGGRAPWLAGHQVGELIASAVHPDAQGNGVGTSMLDMRLEHLRREGCRYVVVASWVHAEPAHASLGMLRPAGFTVAAVIPEYWSAESGPDSPCPYCGDMCACAAAVMVLDTGR